MIKLNLAIYCHIGLPYDSWSTNSAAPEPNLGKGKYSLTV